MNPKPTVGRIVIYTLPAHAECAGEIRPALITRVLTNYDGSKVYGVNLHVMQDASDRLDGVALYNETPAAVPLNEDPRRPVPGTWHWPPRE